MLDVGCSFRSASLRPLLTLALIQALFLYCSSPTFAQKRPQDRPVPIEPAAGQREGHKLVQEILLQRPSEAPTNGTLRIRDAEANERSFPVRMQISETKTNWTFTYEALAAKGKVGDKLIIIHTFGKPNRYLFTKSGETEPRELSGNQTMIPFADSDFWVADLGLEFLSWPTQRAVRREMRSYKSCVMLESTNPSPAPGAYARVESWLTIESPHAPVTAQAYDASGKQIKVFTVESVERIEGHYQLRSIEMRNLKTKTRSIIEFEL
jgi:hypothetical protein